MARLRRLAFLASLLVVPWSVQFFPGGFGLRFVWGMVSFDPLVVSALTDYLRVGGSPLVFSWLMAAGLYALACLLAGVSALARRRKVRGSVVLGAIDDRLVAGLLVLAGVANISVAWTFSVQPGRVAIPVGTLVLWLVAWRW